MPRISTHFFSRQREPDLNLANIFCMLQKLQQLGFGSFPGKFFTVYDQKLRLCRCSRHSRTRRLMRRIPPTENKETRVYVHKVPNICNNMTENFHFLTIWIISLNVKNMAYTLYLDIRHILCLYRNSCFKRRLFTNQKGERR